MPTSLPGWLLRRMREMQARCVHVLLPPAGDHAAAVYLLDAGDVLELHAVDDAASGIDGCTIPLTRREVTRMMTTFVGALSGRLHGEIVTWPEAAATETPIAEAAPPA